MQTVLNTVGDGYWSCVAKAVRITDITLGWATDERDYGELCVYFNTDDWDVEHEGLIYTDSKFLQELRDFLTDCGLTGYGVEYSEQGMQGEDYVSLDVGKTFIKAWDTKFVTA